MFHNTEYIRTLAQGKTKVERFNYRTEIFGSDQTSNKASYEVSFVLRKHLSH